MGFVRNTWPEQSDTNKRRICYSRPVPLRTCAVSFLDIRGIRHVAEVQAESLYEAAILADRVFKGDPWAEDLASSTPLDMECASPQPSMGHAQAGGAIARRCDDQSERHGEEVEAENADDGAVTVVVPTISGAYAILAVGSSAFSPSSPSPSRRPVRSRAVPRFCRRRDHRAARWAAASDCSPRIRFFD